ncbi:MAG: flavin reductase [Halioglobus sp.]|nr:flavin reductase [Halioglobus sp.]
MPGRRRAAFVNSLSGFKSANLVGTADAAGRSNLAIMSSAVHLGSSPALMALVIRPGGEERHTLHNILATEAFSINHVTADIVPAAHQTAARYPRDICEFTATGLTPAWVEGFAAPLVAEAGLRLGLRLREHQRLAINATHLLIGEIVLVELQESWLNDAGGVDLHRAGSIALSGLDTYYAPLPLKRMAYAKPDLPPREIAIDAPTNLDDSLTNTRNRPALTQTGDAAAHAPGNSAPNSHSREKRHESATGS